MALADKGAGVDLLVMTATPIPRTLMMTAYGDIDVSKLTEKPAGRQPIDTRTVPLERLHEVADGLKRAIAHGARIYGSAPWWMNQKQSTSPPRPSGTACCARPSAIVGLVHGKQKAAERDATMAAFAAGNLDILVATTVIEVGVNVPEATVMVVEHAERFGLAQLHSCAAGSAAAPPSRTACCSTRRRSARPPRPACRSCARPRMASGSRRRICVCAAAASCFGTRQSGLPSSTTPTSRARRPAGNGARRCQADRGTRPAAEIGTRRALRMLLYLFRQDSAIKNWTSG